MQKEIVWLDGSRDADIPGKLLSENINYYGDLILTDIKYKYLTPLTGIGDTAADDPDLTGRRLLDGLINYAYDKKPAEASGGELTVLFELNSVYSLCELDFICSEELSNVNISVSCDGIDYVSVHNEKDIAPKPLVRCRFNQVSAKFIKLELDNKDRIRLFQVWLWGDSLSKDEKGGTFSKGSSFEFANSIAMESIVGVPSTAFSDIDAFHWYKSLENNNLENLDVVWSEQDAYGSFVHQTILPKADIINKKISRRICRKGSEVVCLALTNTDLSKPKDVNIEIINNSGLRTKMYAAGAIETRWYGDTVGPLFNEECCISKPLMRKYIKNARVIEDFPLIHLPIAGTCLIWIVIFGDEQNEGKYSFKVKAGNSEVEIEADILPITLDRLPVGVCNWGYKTNMYPFEWNDRAKVEAAYRNEIGTNVYEICWPENGNVGEEALKENPTVQFMVGGIGDYVHLLYNNQVTAEQVEAEAEDYLKNTLKAAKDKAERLGLAPNQWFIYMPDEPGAHNAKACGAVLKICKKLYPEIRVYANPAFWTGIENDVCAADEKMCEALEGWYDMVDISLPLLCNLWNRPESYKEYTAPHRESNGQYMVSGQHMCSDRPEYLQLSRASAWESISRDMNWWGFYAYHCPRLNTWDNRLCMNRHVDFTINYQCVHSGLYGPVPTRASEGIREGYQDYHIMYHLKQHNEELYKEIQQEFLNGKQDYASFRNRALDAILASK